MGIFRRTRLGQANGLPLLQQLQQEAATKREQVKALQKTLSDLQAQLAALKDEPPPNGNGEPLPFPPVGELPWYRRYWKWLAAGGVGTVIAGIAIAAKKKK